MERSPVFYPIPIRDVRAAVPLDRAPPARTELLSLAVTCAIDGECSRCLKPISSQELACLVQFRGCAALRFHYACYRAWDDAW
jgi:hypothetical protein